MTTNDDLQIQKLIEKSSVGHQLRMLETNGQVTWAKFKSASGYLTVDETWNVDSTVESVAEALISQAERRLSNLSAV